MKKFFTAIALGFIAGSCAVTSSPTGGPKDEIPPKIVSVSPASGQRNLQTNEVAWTFDEYIKDKNAKKELMVVPEIEGFELEFKGKKVTASWPGTLRPNTTYFIDLGEGVADITEGNPAQNVQFVWSTGEDIDSLQVDGHVHYYGTEEVDEFLVVLLEAGAGMEDSTFTPIQKRKVKDGGTFEFSYLPNGVYDVLCFQDLNFNGTWDNNELYGFSKGLSSNLDSSLAEIVVAGSLTFGPSENGDSIMNALQSTLDTSALENVGTVVLQMTLPELGTKIELVGENGWQQWVTLPMANEGDTISVEFESLLPGNYVVQGFVDQNGNGSWDAANFWENSAPEEVLTPTVIEVKANWEIEQWIAVTHEE